MNTKDNEIRSYLKSSNTDITFGAFAIFAFVIQLIAASNGRFLKTLAIFLLIYAALALIWYAQRRSTYIAVNFKKESLDAVATFFLPRRSIPIASIVHIGTRGMFAGGLTVMAVTYILPNGRKKTVNVGGKESLDQNFGKILDALVAINPKLDIPAELRK